MLFSKLFKWDENIVVSSKKNDNIKTIPEKSTKINNNTDKTSIKKVKSIDAVSKLLNEDPFFLSC